MRSVVLHEEVQHRGWINLHHLTDFHAGAPDFAEEELKERIALIADDPDARWTFGGDGGDLIRHNDRRYTPTELHWRYRQATDITLATQQHLVELLKPIADKCWAYADGNHERKVDEHYGGHFGPEVCTRLGIEKLFVDYRGMVRVNFKIKPRGAHLSQIIDIQHGWQAGRGKGAFHGQAEKELGFTDGDIILRGHSHRPDKAQFVVPTLNHSGQMVVRPRTVINGGSWRRNYRTGLAPVTSDTLHETERSMWGESKGFRIEPVGGPVLRIKFDEGNGRSGGRQRLWSCNVTHTVFTGDIDAVTLGL